MNQEEADQDVADEVSEEVDSRRKVMRSRKNEAQRLYNNDMISYRWIVNAQFLNKYRRVLPMHVGYTAGRGTDIILSTDTS